MGGVGGTEEPIATEIPVLYQHNLGLWVWCREESGRVVMRTSNAATGPWSEPTILV